MKVSGQGDLAKGWGRACARRPAPANPIRSEVRMATLTHPRPRVNRKPRVKPARTARVSPVGESGRRILTLAAGKESWVYWLDAVATDFGEGYALEKFEGGDVYHVHLDATGDSCT